MPLVRPREAGLFVEPLSVRRRGADVDSVSMGRPDSAGISGAGSSGGNETSFTLSFSCTPGALVGFLYNMSQSPYFFVVDYLEVEKAGKKDAGGVVEATITMRALNLT